MRLLARLGGTAAPEAGPAFAERLGDWLSWTGAISLAAAMNAEVHAPAAASGDDATRCQADVERVRATLSASIAAGPRDAATLPAEFAPFRRHCLAQQQTMHEAIQALRQRLRRALAVGSADQVRLAAIDAVMDQGLAAQERALLGLVPVRLQMHFERLQRTADTDERWVDTFRHDFTSLLLAELNHRLLPAAGLLSALLGTRTAPPLVTPLHS